jgi:hypothetical protein
VLGEGKLTPHLHAGDGSEPIELNVFDFPVPVWRWLRSPTRRLNWILLERPFATAQPQLPGVFIDYNDPEDFTTGDSRTFSVEVFGDRIQG